MHLHREPVVSVEILDQQRKLLPARLRAQQFRSSFAQQFLQGPTLKWSRSDDALVGSVIELGRLTGTPTPHIDTVFALMRLLAQSLERANGRLVIQGV